MRHLTEVKSRCQGRNARGNLNEVTAGSSHHKTSSGGRRMSTEEASTHAVNWAFVLVETGMAMTALKAPSVKRLVFLLASDSLACLLNSACV